MATHDLKCDTEHFQKIVSGAKTFEFRLNDRNYQVGDVLVLNESMLGGLRVTGKKQNVLVTHVLNASADGRFTQAGYCILSFRKLYGKLSVFKDTKSASYGDYDHVNRALEWIEHNVGDGVTIVQNAMDATQPTDDERR